MQAEQEQGLAYPKGCEPSAEGHGEDAAVSCGQQNVPGRAEDAEV